MILCTFLICLIAPTGAPRDVVLSTTSRSVGVSWNTIKCIERNGMITDYTVEFQEQGGAMILAGEVNVMDRTFIATGLQPFTRYMFRVAGVNDAGTGPFTAATAILTNEESMLLTTTIMLSLAYVAFLHIAPAGAVSNFTAIPGLFSVMLTWSPPQEPNGVIISYEVTYTVNDGNPVRTFTTDLTFTISSLTPGTRVSNISVSAYNSEGIRGAVLQHYDVTTLNTPRMCIKKSNWYNNYCNNYCVLAFILQPW